MGEAQHGDVVLQNLHYRVRHCSDSGIARMYQRTPKAWTSATPQGELQMIPAESLRSTVIPDAGGLSRAISIQGLQETATLDLWVFA